MDPDPRDAEAAPREVRIQGLALFVSGGVLVAMLVLAFFAGRWFERQVAPRAGEIAGREPASETAKVDAKAEDLTFFDTLGGGKAAEPHREARPKPPAPETPSNAPAAEPPPAASSRAGPYFVQVFAGRDRKAAEEIVRALGGHGYPVSVESEREGQGALFKVRVGGYRERSEAQTVAERLKREGQAGAWVTKAD